MAIPTNLYPYTDLHEANMDYVLEQIKQLIEAWAETKGEWDETMLAWSQTEEAWTELKNYVENYFDNLDVQQEINNKIDEMVLDGTMQQLIQNVITSMIIDAAPTQNSDNLVKSGGVWQAIKDVTDAYTNDVEEDNFNAVTSDGVWHRFENVVGHHTAVVPGNGTYKVEFTDSRCGYLIAGVGAGNTRLCIFAGAGYGAGATRNVLTTLLAGSDVTAAVDNDSFAVNITNLNANAFNLHVLEF